MSSACSFRVCPTTSSKRSRHAFLSDTPEIEKIQENVDSGDEESKELTRPFRVVLMTFYPTQLQNAYNNQYLKSKDIFFLHNIFLFNICRIPYDFHCTQLFSYRKEIL